MTAYRSIGKVIEGGVISPSSYRVYACLTCLYFYCFTEDCFLGKLLTNILAKNLLERLCMADRLFVLILLDNGN